jgi:hypothetical protein
MAKVVVMTKTEAKARQIELAWRKRETELQPRISKEKAWEQFHKLREKALGY